MVTAYIEVKRSDHSDASIFGVERRLIHDIYGLWEYSVSI